MALSADLTPVVRIYSKITERPTSTVRKVAGEEGTVQLSVSHETAKSGLVSSVMIFDDSLTVTSSASAPIIDNYRLMVKLQRNPLGGRADGPQTIIDMRAELIALLSDDTSWAKFLNQEH
jgi:hypothetical protein